MDTLINSTLEDFEFDIFHEGEIKKAKMSDYKGKWLVLFFYPADFTFVCPTELEELASLYEDFKKEGAEIISFSTDTAFVHKGWHDTSDAIKKVTFPMGSDANAYISSYLGIFIEKEGLSLRGSFIVDPDGVIKSMEVNNNDIGRSAKELLRKLRAAKFVKEHDGQVCPASWEPGDDTLTPGVDLVGKI